MTQKIMFNTQWASIPAELVKAGVGAPKTNEQVSIDSKPPLIVRINKCVYSLFQKLSHLFIPKPKSNDDLIIQVGQIYKTAQSKLQNEIINLKKTVMKTIRKRLQDEKIQPKEINEINEIFLKAEDLLNNTTDTLKKEELKQHIKKLKKTYTTVIKLKNQIQPIINYLGNTFNNEEKKATTILNHTIKQVNDIQNKYSKFNVENNINSMKEELTEKNNHFKRQLEEVLNDFKNYNIALETVSYVLSHRYWELSTLDHVNHIYVNMESALNNHYNGCKKELTYQYNSFLKRLKKYPHPFHNLRWDNIQKKPVEKYKEILTKRLTTITKDIAQHDKMVNGVRNMTMNLQRPLNSMCNCKIQDLKIRLRPYLTLKAHADSLVTQLETKSRNIKTQFSNLIQSHEVNDAIKHRSQYLKECKTEIEIRLKRLDDGVVAEISER